MATTSFFTEIFGPDQGNSNSAVQGVFEKLLTHGTDGKIVPMLAERWENSPDGKSWTYYLRKGVQFHGGWGEFTAEDVKFSAEEGSKKGSLNTTYGTWKKNLDSIDIINPYQVRFNFKGPYVLMPTDAATSANDTVIVSKKYYAAVGAEQAARKPIGTGPFKFVEHKIGDTIRLEAMPNHWRQTPGFQYVVFKVVPESASAIQMLKAGDIDIASIDASDIDGLKALGFNIAQGSANFAYYVGLGGLMPPAARPKEFDPKIPWVGDPSSPASLEKAYKLRLALALGIDRESILRNILKGAGSLYAVPLYEPGKPWTDPGWKLLPYDPAKAKQLLAEAGYPSFEFTLWTYPMSGRSDLPKFAEAIAMQWQQIGVKANIKLTDSASFKPANQKPRKLGFAAFTETVSRKDVEPTTQFSTYFSSTATYYNGIEDPRLDALQKKILSEPDVAKRYELEKQRGKLLVDNAWIIPGVHKNIVWAASPKVAKWRPDPSPTGNRPDLEYAIPKK